MELSNDRCEACRRTLLSYESNGDPWTLAFSGKDRSTGEKNKVFVLQLCDIYVYPQINFVS